MKRYKIYYQLGTEKLTVTVTKTEKSLWEYIRKLERNNNAKILDVEILQEVKQLNLF